MTKVKVLFELDPDDWHAHSSESLWAEPAGSSDGAKFCLLNTPFFARGVSFEDIVEATFIEGSQRAFQFKDVAERGGHSTFMILAEVNEPRLDAYWGLLESEGCTYEGATLNLSIGLRRLLAVDVPPSADLDDVYDLLRRGEHDKVWMFQEGYVHVAGSTQSSA